MNAQEREKEITDPAEVMDECETSGFSQVVHEAEKVGKPVWPVAVVGRNCYDLILQAAHQLRSSHVVIGASSKMSLSKQQQEMRAAWQRLPARHSLWKLFRVKIGNQTTSSWGENGVDSKKV